MLSLSEKIIPIRGIEAQLFEKSFSNRFAKKLASEQGIPMLDSGQNLIISSEGISLPENITVNSKMVNKNDCEKKSHVPKQSFQNLQINKKKAEAETHLRIEPVVVDTKNSADFSFSNEFRIKSGKLDGFENPLISTGNVLIYKSESQKTIALAKETQRIEESEKQADNPFIQKKEIVEPKLVINQTDEKNPQAVLDSKKRVNSGLDKPKTDLPLQRVNLVISEKLLLTNELVKSDQPQQNYKLPLKKQEEPTFAVNSREHLHTMPIKSEVPGDIRKDQYNRNAQLPINADPNTIKYGRQSANYNNRMTQLPLNHFQPQNQPVFQKPVVFSQTNVSNIQQQVARSKSPMVSSHPNQSNVIYLTSYSPIPSPSRFTANVIRPGIKAETQRPQMFQNPKLVMNGLPTNNNVQVFESHGNNNKIGSVPQFINYVNHNGVSTQKQVVHHNMQGPPQQFIGVQSVQPHLIKPVYMDQKGMVYQRAPAQGTQIINIQGQGSMMKQLKHSERKN